VHAHAPRQLWNRITPVQLTEISGEEIYGNLI
jgi:hypothetical protein